MNKMNLRYCSKDRKEIVRPSMNGYLIVLLGLTKTFHFTVLNQQFNINASLCELLHNQQKMNLLS